MQKFREIETNGGMMARRSSLQKKTSKPESKDIYRLVSINGKPLSSTQEQKENQRIQALLHDPSRQQKAMNDQAQDFEKMKRFMKVNPFTGQIFAIP